MAVAIGTVVKSLKVQAEQEGVKVTSDVAMLATILEAGLHNRDLVKLSLPLAHDSGPSSKCLPSACGRFFAIRKLFSQTAEPFAC